MYRYADGRAKYIDLQMEYDCVCYCRVLSHDNTDNLHEIKVTNSLVSLNKEGVVRVQHPTTSLIKLKGLDRNELKEASESVVNIGETYFRLQRETYR